MLRKIRTGATLALLLAALTNPLAAAAANVAAHDGDLYYRDGHQAERRLTHDGGNEQPALSPDGQWLAFVHVFPPAGGDDSAETSELWLMRADGSGRRRLTAVAASDDPQGDLSRVSNPAFSPDGGTLYFMARAWATSDAIHAVELASGKQRFLCDGNSLDVITAGRLTGHLIVEKHKYPSNGPAYDAQWLISPQGREIRRLREAEARRLLKAPAVQPSAPR
ncbi:MAG: hypothetical protein PHQ73_01720 [Gallionella sp.]|nr:hypothetical protein [Gallionella sp.]